MDDQVVTVVGLVVAGILGGIGTWWSQRKLKKAGVAVDHATAVQNLRDAADGWEEKYRLELEGRRAAQEQLLAAKTGHDAELAKINAERAWERAAARECREDLDDARSKIRELEREIKEALGRRRRPRPIVEETE